MKLRKVALATAMMGAIGGLYGCSGGDDVNITIDAPVNGGGGGGTGTISLNCPTWAAARPVDADGNDVCLPQTITQDRTLTADIVWLLNGRVTVGNGNGEMSATEGELENGADVLNVDLSIEPGTQIKGETGTFANLLITRGSRIFAEGEEDAPIVFSSDDDGFEGSGEWGGLIIHGYGPHNDCDPAGAGTVACNIDSEGESGFANGYTADDDSGILRYVVLAEGGFEFAPGDEINGISFMGVGSATTMEYIQVNGNSDDGIEFYGGTVNGKYIVLTGNLDDSVDWDEGFQGNLQYVLVIQDPATQGNAIEADTEGTTLFDSKPTLANATFIADGTNDEALVFKVSSGGFLLNSIVDVAAGNTSITACVNVDGPGAEGNIGGSLAFNNVITNCTTFGQDATDDTLAAVGVTQVDPQLDANYAAQDAAAAGVAIDVPTFNSTYAESTADDTFLDDTDYIGAVDPAATTFWYEGWTLDGSL